MGRHAFFATFCRNCPNTFSGIFQLIASLMIFVMGVTMLKMENARTKWRVKLQNAFNGQRRHILVVRDAPLTSFRSARSRRENRQMGPLLPPHDYCPSRGQVPSPYHAPLADLLCPTTNRCRGSRLRRRRCPRTTCYIYSYRHHRRHHQWHSMRSYRVPIRKPNKQVSRHTLPCQVFPLTIS